LLAPLVLSCAGAACSSNGDPAVDRASTVTIAYPDPAVDAFDSEARFLVFLPLLVRNERGELEGQLARSWELSSDHLDLTYHLRSDIRWHDGRPVTARDIEFTLELLTRPEVAGFSERIIESVTVVDDSTVTVRAGSDWLYAQWWTVFLPAHLLEGLDPKEFYEWAFWTEPVGNGPYRFVRYVPETFMEFEADPDYYGGKPRIERVTLKFVEGAPLTELLSSNVDAIWGASPAQVRTLAADSRFEAYHSFSLYEARVIYWQTDHPILGDPRIRRAMTLAIDRRGILRLLDFPDDVPLADGPFTARQLRTGDLPEPLPYDPEAARSLLEAAGWIDADGDGMRERDGTELQFSAIPVAFFAQPDWQELVVYVQDQLRNVGVQMEIKTLDYGAAMERFRRGDYEAFFAWINVGLPSYMEQYLGEDNPIRLENPRAGALVERAKITLDPEARDRVYEELAMIYREEVPVTFLFPDPWRYVAHRRLRGLSSPWRTDPLMHMDELWIEEDGED
jgi:peptide/nickel transport system substrate-binding protein